MRLPTQQRSHRIAGAYAPAVRSLSTRNVAPSGIQPSSCCDGNVTITSPQGQVLYTGVSGCCYDSGQAYCYPCGGEQASWEAYAKTHFTACQTSTPCSITLGGCGKLTPYC
jgi:hypothetical protein